MARNRYKILEEKNIVLDQLYFQYVPKRFEKAFKVKPSKNTLHITCLPHIDLLKKYMESGFKDLEKTNYYKMHKSWGRKDGWIRKKIHRFVKLFKDVSKNGLKKPIIITKKPLYKKFHDGYEIYEGHHRASIYVVLNKKMINSKIVEFI